MNLVCYLVAPGDIYAERAELFMESYAQYPAGAPHDLVIIQKDGSQPIHTNGWCEQAEHLSFVHHPNEGYDIGSFQRICATEPGYDLVLWLGSWARILATDWLRKMVKPFKSRRMGMTATTGSFEAGVSLQRPNAHLRTGAFVMRPQVLLSLGFHTCYTRMDTYEFEHGIHSLYRRIQRCGLDGVVVDKHGAMYSEDSWEDSYTYRRGEQHNLLIADHQTETFAVAGSEDREMTARMAGWEPI